MFWIVPPFDLRAVFGKGRVKVRGTINGVPYRSSVMPMGGTPMMVLNKELRAKIGLSGGETLRVTMEEDTEERTVPVPRDLARLLAKEKKAKAFFNALAYTYRKEYVRWIENAKRPETRATRLTKTVAMLKRGVKWPGT